MNRFYIFSSSFLLSLLLLACSQQNPAEFEQVGVIEGFYGTPWSHEARADMVEFMGEMGMTAYYYAPKNDPYHRSKWREPYQGEWLQHFQSLIKTSEEAEVDLYFAISPGMDMVYSDSADFAALKNKIQDVRNLGVNHVALFFDDVPGHLRHEADKAAYSDLADAHVDVINRLWDSLKEDGVELVVCPTTYTSAWGSRDYVEKLGEQVHKEIPLFWTGEDTAIEEITHQQTKNWGNLLERKPLIWDNFPVNDFEVWRPIIGPLRGRDATLPKVAEGIIANPMELPYSSMIPLYTVAKYGKDPQNYQPDLALSEAVEYLGGKKAFPYLMPIVKVYADYGWTDNIFTSVYTPGTPLDEEKLFQTLDELDAHFSALSSPEFQDNEYVQHFVSEIEPFVSKTRKDLEELLASDREPVTYTPGFTKQWEGGSLEVEQGGEFLNFTLRVNKEELPKEWIVVLTESSEPKETWLQPEDLILRWNLTDDEPRADHFHLTPFSQRGISDINVRTITSFFEHFTVPSETTIHGMKENKESQTVYTIKVPAPQNSKIRFNVFVNPGFNLSKQVYLGNPYTYPILEMD